MHTQVPPAKRVYDCATLDRMAFMPGNLAPFERYPEQLAALRVQLGQLLDHHTTITGRVVGAGGQLFVVDLWVMGVAQRSFHLLDGFIETFDSWNVTVAAPLVRFQLENVYRTSYIASAPNGPEVVHRVMGGTPLRKLKAHDTGKPLTDRELVERARLHWPWLPDVYEKSNEWVHLSERHIFNASRLAEGEDSDGATMIGLVPLPPEWIPVSFLAELLEAMNEATRSLFALFEGYETWKLEHPTAEPAGLDLDEPPAGPPT